MNIKIYIKVTRLGRLQMSKSDVEFSTPHGSMSCQDGILIDDPTYVDTDSVKAMEIVIDFAEKRGIRYSIYNVANSWPALRAWLAGVKTYPTVFIGGRKIEGVPTRAEIEQSCS